MSEGYLMSLKTAVLLFRYCRRYGVAGRKERTAVLARIAAKKKAMYFDSSDTIIKLVRDRRN